MTKRSVSRPPHLSPQIILSSGRGASPPFRRIGRSNAEKSARSRRSAKKAAVFMAACFSETAVATNSSPGNRIVGLCRQHQCRTTTALFVMNERRIKVDPDEIAGFGTILRLPVTRLRANAPVDFVMTVLRRNAPDELVEGVAPLAALWLNRLDSPACRLARSSPQPCRRARRSPAPRPLSTKNRVTDQCRGSRRDCAPAHLPAQAGPTSDAGRRKVHAITAASRQSLEPPLSVCRAE